MPKLPLHARASRAVVRAGLCGGLLVMALVWRAPKACATDSSFSVAGAQLILSGVTNNEAAVFYQSMRLNRALNAWNVDVWVTNTSARSFQAPLLLRVDGFSGTAGPMAADGTDTNGLPFFDLSANLPNGVLQPNQRSTIRTLTLAVGSGVPKLQSRLFEKRTSSTAALIITRSLNEVGQPLPGVQVTDLASSNLSTTEPDLGAITLSGPPGARAWKFAMPGFYPVWRQQNVIGSTISVLPSPRLSRIDTNVVNLTPIDGGTISNGNTSISFPPGAFAQNTIGHLKELSGQTLPALLPAGWSPLSAFWLQLDNEPAISGTASLIPWGAIASTEIAGLVKWDETNLQWTVVQTLTGNGTNAPRIPLGSSGAYALVVGDIGPLGPALPQAGQALAPGSTAAVDYSLLKVTGTVRPASSPASRNPELVTGTATLSLSNSSGPLSSGLLLRGQIHEDYRLRDGTHQITPEYENYIVAYQRPASSGGGALQATFPMRPILLLGPEELDTSLVQATVFSPSSFTGGVLDDAGGEISADGITIVAGSGDVSGPQAISLHGLSPTNFLDWATNGLSVVKAFELVTAGIQAGHKFVVQAQGLAFKARFVLAKVLTRDGIYGLEPRERLVTDGVGRLSSLEPLSPPALSGITGAGQYVLIQVSVPQGLVTGVARNSAGVPAAGLLVQSLGAPWMTFSDSTGAYKLVAPAGNVQLAMIDPTTGDRGTASTLLSEPSVAASADLSPVVSGPTASLLQPTNGSVGVATVSPVMVGFSEAINPGTLGTNGVQLFDASNALVNATLTLNLQNTVATLLPIAPLAAAAQHTVLVSSNILDLNGRSLAGTNAFTFTTASDALNRTAAELVSYEPTNGIARMEGGPGIADPNSPVILVDQTSGQTTTVLSNPDGSFTNFISADVDDILSAVMVNQNGTRTTVPVSRQIFGDGSIGLFNGGGILEAQSDGGPVQIIVEPGTVPGKTQFRVQTVPVAQLLGFANGVQPQGGQVLGGIRLEEQGDELNTPLHVEFPLNLSALNLPPGTTPDQLAYALTVPHQFDGVVVYEIVDGMAYENGKLVTHSPPFPGVNVRALIRNAATSARGSDTLQDRIAQELPQFGASAGLLFAPVVVGTGEPTTLIGRVYSVATDPTTGQPKLLALQKPVAGAVVTVVGDNAVLNTPGQLQPGQFIALSDEQGNVALRVPSETPTSPSGFILRASHPRFPSQAPTATLTRAAGSEVPFSRFSIPFVELDLSGLDTPDILPPVIRVTQTPANPLIGTNNGQGVTLTVAAIDDRNVASLTISVSDVLPLTVNPPANLAASVNLVELSQTPGSTALTKVVQLQSAAKARVTLHLVATDQSGNRGVLDQQVFFSNDAANPPPPSSDTSGPRIVFVWPPNGATGVIPNEPILLRFSEPVSFTSFDAVVTFSTGHKVTAATLSPDGREINISYSGPADGKVSYSAGRIFDLAGNALSSGFNATFEQALRTTANLPQMQNGGGIVQKGSYAFGLERNGDRGKLLVFDVGNPGASAVVGSLELPSYPRDLALMPQYAYKLRTSDPQCLTNDLLAIVGGLVGAPTSDEGSFYQGQFLWLVDVGDPTAPKLVPNAKTVLTFAIAAVTKVRWVPPHLAYLESGPDGSSVGLINVQSFLIGMNASDAERQLFPVEGFDGLATNSLPGCYCGAGAQLPLPARNPAAFFGKEFSFTPAQSSAGNQPVVVDFDFENLFALLGVIISGDPTNAPGDPPKYQTLYSGTGFLDPSATSFEFKRDDVVRRMAILTGVDLKQFASDSGGAFTTTTRNLAVVSAQSSRVVKCIEGLTILAGEATPMQDDVICPLDIYGTLVIPSNSTLRVHARVVVEPGGSISNFNALAAYQFEDLSTNRYPTPPKVDEASQTIRTESLFVIDITDPGHPTLVNVLFLPEKLPTTPPVAVGRIQSIQRRGDGLLALATDAQVFLLDPTLLALPQRQYDVTAWPPAIQGAIPGAGSGARSFSSTPMGVNLVNLGGKHQVLRTAPALDWISFGPATLTNLVVPSILASSNDFYKADRLNNSTGPSLLLKSRFVFFQSTDATGQTQLIPNPAGPTSPYYLRVDAPGDAGPTISLIAEGVSASGAPAANHATNGMPGRLASSATLSAVGDNAQTLFPTGLTAYRLSNNRQSDLYNVYLSDPVFLVSQNLTPNQLLAVLSICPTQPKFLRPEKYLWGGFDPQQPPPGVADYASSVILNHVVPGTAALAAVEKERLPLVFIPGMAASRLADLLDFPTQDEDFYGPLLNHVQGFATAQLNIDVCTERWPAIGLDRKNRLSRSPYDRAGFPGGNFPVMGPYDAMRYIPELLCGKASALKEMNIYGPLLDRLEKEEGYTEYLYTNPLIKPYNIWISSQIHCKNDSSYFAPQVPNLFVFPYDWRFDNTNAVGELAKLVQIIRQLNPEADKINILAHSMGGLIARRFALAYPDTVEKIITVGTPWLGAPKAINALETGDFEIPDFIIDSQTLKPLVEYFPAAHQLLPSRSYFSFGPDASPVAELGYDLDGNGVNNGLLGYEQYRRMMDARCHCDPASKPIANANEPFHSYVNSAGSAQDDWRNDTSSTKYYHFYGVQRAPLTVTRFVAAGRMRQVVQTNNDLLLDMPQKYRTDTDAATLHPASTWIRATNYWVIRPEYLTERGAGDKTVPVLSLSRSNAMLNLNRPDARLVSFYSPDFAHDGEVEHTQILSTKRVQDALVDTLADLEPVGDPMTSGDVSTFTVRISGMAPGTQDIQNPLGRARVKDFTTSRLGEVLNSVQDFAPAAAGFVQSVYQQASSYAGGAFNWAFECTNGVSFQPAGADTVEFEFVGGVPTTLNFKTANAPLAVRVVRKNNSAPIQSLTWTTVPVAAGTQMTMTFDNGAFQSLQDNQGTTYAPDLTRSENGSLDYSIPSLGYHLQEMSGWTNVVFDWTNDSPVTRTSNLVFIAEDINLNGTPLDDRWLPLTNYPPSLDLTNLLGRDPQLYAIVQNDAGNLSQPIKLEFAGDPAGAECRLFNLEKTKLLETVNEGITEALNLGFLLDRRHVALFEQGSGACLWATDPCITCSGAYTPGKSDHDLELFLPLVVDPTDPLHHEALTPANAFLPATLEGNWYHRGPTNPNGPAPYQYEVPPGFSPGGTLSWNGIPASGDLPAIVAQPDTPAQIIARIFDRLRHQPDVLAVLPDVSFFPERRDHFESGILHLNRPPNEGDDPLGDAGHGRQLLLLKWVLEGRWVTGFEGLSLDQVYANMQSQVFPSLNNSQNGIPAVEGFEWGRLQEHAALKSGILLRAVDMVDPAEPNPRAKNFLYDTFVGQVKKVGKGAMRAALAEIAGLAGPGITNLFISRAQYQSGNFKTFEDFVAAACSNQFIKLFSAPDLDLIGRSAKAKVADPVFIQQLLSDECAANRYLADALNFIRAVQTKTTPSFNDYMSFIQTNGMPGSAEQFAARTDNINFLYSGVTNPPSLSNLLHHAALDVVLRVFNLGPDPLPGTDLRMWIDGQERTNLSSDLDPFQVRYFKGQHYIAPPLGIQPFFVESDVDPASYGIPHTVDIVVSSSGRAPPGGGAPPGGTTAPFQTDWEPNSCNNWIRFRYYLFDPASPCPSIPFIVVPPPPNVHCTTSEICPGRRNLP